MKITLILAHRGYSAKYPENTMLAFREAEEAGADGIELDVQLSKDGKVVVIHDEKVNRTTNGKGYVKDLDFKELRTLNAAHKTKFQRESIPSLEEVLQWMTTNEIICNIELKNNVFRYQRMEEAVIQLIRQYKLTDRVILSSFNHYSLIYAYRCAPEIEMAPIVGQAIYMPWVYAKAMRAKGIHPRYKAYSPDILKQSLQQGIAVRPYTVNKEADMKTLYQLSSSAIITDDPVLAVTIREKIKA